MWEITSTVSKPNKTKRFISNRNDFKITRVQNKHKITFLNGDSIIKFNKRHGEGKDTVGWAGWRLEAGRRWPSGAGNYVGRARDTAGRQRKHLASLVEAGLIMTKVGGPWWPWTPSVSKVCCGGGGAEGLRECGGLGAHLQKGLWSPPSLDMSVVMAGFWEEREHENQTP